LKESERRFRTLIRDLHTGVFLQDPEGRILLSNKAMHTMFDVKEEELLNQRIWESYSDVIHENGRTVTLEERPTYRAIQTRQLVADMVMGIWQKSKARYIWLLVSADPILDEEGKLRHVVCSFTDITERKKLEQELLEKQVNHQRQITQATIDGQENERREIGRELHDNIGQQLTTIKLFLDLARTSTESHADEMMAMAQKGIGELINEVRAISRALVPSTLKDLGLSESITELVESIGRSQLLHIGFESFDFDEDQLKDNQKLTLFRIIQEQLNNIVRHADAREVRIDLNNRDGQLVLEIRDDGNGFDPGKLKKGLGIQNMQNRAELFQGKAEIISQPGQGCLLRVSMPFISANPSLS
jgi:PAS domain S-box-containing protein